MWQIGKRNVKETLGGIIGGKVSKYLVRVIASAPVYFGSELNSIHD